MATHAALKHQASKRKPAAEIARTVGPKLLMWLSVALWWAITWLADKCALPADVRPSATSTTGYPSASARRAVVSTQNSDGSRISTQR